MFQLDDNLLHELGLGSLPPVEKNKMLGHIYETLELRVGMRLAEQMTDEQLDEFEGFIDRNDEAGALNWLETNFPDYKKVVAEELERLKGEIKAQAPAIVEATNAELQANSQSAQAGQQSPQAQPHHPQHDYPPMEQLPSNPDQDSHNSPLEG
jgi:septum formation inhibitor MinC